MKPELYSAVVVFNKKGFKKMFLNPFTKIIIYTYLDRELFSYNYI